MSGIEMTPLGIGDLGLVLELVRRSDRHDGVPHVVQPGDLRRWFELLDPDADTIGVFVDDTATPRSVGAPDTRGPMR